MAAPDPHPEDIEDDHDYPHPRKPKKSIGEELFQVHLKRSEGLEPDYDVEPDSNEDKVKKPDVTSAKDGEHKSQMNESQ